MKLKLPKSFTTITPFTKFLALSMLIVFPIVGFFLGMKYQETKSAKVNIVNSDSLFDWKTYSNKQFTFKYPLSHEIITNNQSGLVIGLNSYLEMKVFYGYKTNLKSLEYCPSGEGLNQPSVCLNNWPVENIQIDGRDAVSFNVYEKPKTNKDTDTGTDYRVIQISNPGIEIQFYGATLHAGISDLILSTFKFIN